MVLSVCLYSVCLSVCISVCVCVSICKSVRLQTYSSAYVSLYPSVSVSISPIICLSVCLSLFLSVCISVCLSVCPSVFVSVNLPICLSLSLSIHVFVRLSNNVDIFGIFWNLRSTNFLSISPCPYFLISFYYILSCLFPNKELSILYTLLLVFHCLFSCLQSCSCTLVLNGTVAVLAGKESTKYVRRIHLIIFSPQNFFYHILIQSS